MAQNNPKQNKTQKIWENILEIDELNNNPEYFPRLKEGIEEEKEKKQPSRKEFTLFSYSQYYEQEIVKQKIKELTDLIKQEINLIRQSNKALLTEVKDIENLTVETAVEKPGIYHIRFLEVILTILKNLRKKVSESKTWLEALITKKKKRGSLFANRSKKMGTIYSMSQELQTTRSVQ